MKVSQTDLVSGAVILLYIVFFSHSPPFALRSALENVYIAGTLFAIFTYVTLCVNRSIGVLLIVAFILTMTRVTEHLDTGATPTPPTDTPAPTTPPTNIPIPPSPPASSTKTVDSSTVPGMAASTPIETPVTSTATTSAAPSQAAPPVIVAPPTVSAPTAPAVPGVTVTPPAPVMSCNVESFAPF